TRLLDDHGSGPALAARMWNVRCAERGEYSQTTGTKAPCRPAVHAESGPAAPGPSGDSPVCGAQRQLRTVERMPLFGRLQLTGFLQLSASLPNDLDAAGDAQ